LSNVGDTTADWRVSLAKGPFDESGIQWIHEWLEQGSDSTFTVMECGKFSECYLLRFSGLADFLIDFDERQIRSFPMAGQDKKNSVHLLLDQVIPRILAHLGRPVLHASSVFLPDGSVVAFLGPSGWGKSTLAGAFHQRGFKAYSDDCLLVEKRGDDAILAGLTAYPSLRLWSDSRENVFPRTGGFSQVASYTDKQQQFLTVDYSETPAMFVPISALFILGESLASPQDASVQIKLAGGTTATMALIESLFALDVRDKNRVLRNLSWAADLASSELPISVVNFPRKFERLDIVVGAIIKSINLAY
jgi:hypothetical protein